MYDGGEGYSEERKDSKHKGVKERYIGVGCAQPISVWDKQNTYKINTIHKST